MRYEAILWRLTKREATYCNLDISVDSEREGRKKRRSPRVWTSQGQKYEFVGFLSEIDISFLWGSLEGAF